MNAKQIAVALVGWVAMVDGTWAVQSARDKSDVPPPAPRASVPDRTVKAGRSTDKPAVIPTSRVADRVNAEPSAPSDRPNDAGSGTPDTFANRPARR